ncbi:MAG: arsenite methyltransferase [Anaerolineae bacterium]|nr:arsenite methyltransferase [Anaerolineae bacterium]
MAQIKIDTIHDAVQEHYGSIVERVQQSQASSCCGDSSQSAAADCECSSTLYDPQLLENLPVDVTGLSLGCGDPVTIAALNPGETVLDLGSGGGIDCFLAAKQVGESGYVIGVDMTPQMLAKANANKVKMGVENVEFRKGYIEDLPVKDNTIDVMISNCVINLSPDKAAVFADVFRVLKPGGRMSISDIVTEGDFSPELQANMDSWAECVSGAIDAEQYAGLIREAGFVNIEVVDKVGAEEIIERKDGMPRIYSARITAYKPK